MDYMALGSQYLKSYLSSKKIRRALIAGVVIGVGIGGFYINRYFANARQERAITAFHEAIQTYMTAIVTDLDLQNTGQKAAWGEVELAFKTAYDQNSSAKFAPFFLIYEAQSLAGQGQYTQAAKLVGDCLNQMGINSPFYDLYLIMQASFLIDGQDLTGVAQLEKLAQLGNSDYADMAQYYLAQYYLSQDKPDLAQPILDQLSKSASAFGNLAKDYI
jgi:hypothetical protein